MLWQIDSDMWFKSCIHASISLACVYLKNKKIVSCTLVLRVPIMTPCPLLGHTLGYTSMIWGITMVL